MGILHASLERVRLGAHLVLDAAAIIDVGWLAVGMALHLLSQVVRLRGWWNILRAAYPECASLRAAHVSRAYFAGAGLNGLFPARAGDLVKLAVLHRRIPGSTYPTLAATLVPESAFETLCGTALVGWALAQGFLPVPIVRGEVPAPDVSLYLRHPLVALLVTAAMLAATGVLVLAARRRCARLLDRVRQGLAIFASPARFVTGVASWQAAGRIIRLSSLACLLAAFALPVTLGSVLLVMAAQGGGRIVPLAPVAAGIRIAMLSYGLIEITGRVVDPAAVTAFTIGVSAVQFLVTLSIALVLVGPELGTRSPRVASRRARQQLAAAPSPAATAS